MEKVVLDRITRVYRFNVGLEDWTHVPNAEDHFIAYKLYGATEHWYEGKRYLYKKDEIMMINGEDRYSAHQDPEPFEDPKGGCIAVHFSTAGPFDVHFSIFPCTHRPQLRQSFFRLLDDWKQYETVRSDSALYACQAGFYSILSQVLQLRETAGEAENWSERIAEGRAYLMRNSMNSALSLSDAAEHISMSQRRFGELFLRQYRVTPGKFLASCRMEAAAKLLRETDISVTEAAQLSGYSGASYFIRVFHGEMGFSPSEYRKRFKRGQS